MAAISNLASATTVSSHVALTAALENEAVQEIVIGAPFTIGDSDYLQITRPITIDGRGHSMGMTQGLSIKSAGVTIKNMNITIAGDVRNLHVFYIRAIGGQQFPKDILIEGCNIVGQWQGEFSKYGSPNPYHSGINMFENTQVLVKDTNIQNCAIGILVRDGAICQVQNVTFGGNHEDKTLSAKPLMYGAVATPTGRFVEVDPPGEYKQYVNKY